ncbi:MAG: DNA-directed RNA polymerase subunit omega [Planctomycetota bacterium]
MIEALKDDRVINEMGGRFKFTSLVQHRVRELMEGARPLVERQGRSDIEVAVQEIVEGKITLELEADPDASEDDTEE